MKPFWSIDREKHLEQQSNGVVHNLTSGDFSDEEVAKIVTNIKRRIKLYLNERNESLKQDLENNKTALESLE